MNLEGFIREFDPPLWMRKAANEAAEEAANDLGFPGFYISYWRTDPTKPRDVAAGWMSMSLRKEYQNNVINLCVDKLPDVDQVRFAVFHEARHHWQARTQKYDVDGSEDDADQYAFRQSHVIFGFNRDGQRV
jgi:hypothetical protein